MKTAHDAYGLRQVPLLEMPGDQAAIQEMLVHPHPRRLPLGCLRCGGGRAGTGRGSHPAAELHPLPARRGRPRGSGRGCGGTSISWMAAWSPGISSSGTCRKPYAS